MTGCPQAQRIRHACFSISPGNPPLPNKREIESKGPEGWAVETAEGQRNMGVYISILQGANPFLLIRKFCRFDNSHHLSSTTGGSQNPHPPSPEIQPSITWLMRLANSGRRHIAWWSFKIRYSGWLLPIQRDVAVQLPRPQRPTEDGVKLLIGTQGHVHGDGAAQ